MNSFNATPTTQPTASGNESVTKVGTIYSAVVATQFYPQTIREGDHVAFFREPPNLSYNVSIRVYNTSAQPVGLVRWDEARSLATLIDHGKSAIRFRATALRTYDPHQIPLQIDIYMQPMAGLSDLIKLSLRMAGIVLFATDEQQQQQQQQQQTMMMMPVNNQNQQQMIPVNNQNHQQTVVPLVNPNQQYKGQINNHKQLEQAKRTSRSPGPSTTSSSPRPSTSISSTRPSVVTSGRPSTGTSSTRPMTHGSTGPTTNNVARSDTNSSTRPSSTSNDNVGSTSTTRLATDTTDSSLTQSAGLMESEQADWQSEENHLDNLFDKQREKQLTNLPPLPAGLAFADSVTLYPHQELGIRWMLSRELSSSDDVPFFKKMNDYRGQTWYCEVTNKSQYRPPDPIRGGILSDDMGLGKTLQSIGLILGNPPPGKSYSPRDPRTKTEGGMNRKQGGMYRVDKTDKYSVEHRKNLVMPNKSAIRQLKLQDLRSVLRNGGQKWDGQKPELIERIWRCLLDESLPLRYYYTTIQSLTDRSRLNRSTVGPVTASVQETDSPDSNFPIITGCTLVVCPVSVASNWIQQLEEHVRPNMLRVEIYHGSNRRHVLTDIADIDVLITSYGTLGSDLAGVLGSQTKPSTKSPTYNARRNQHAITLDKIRFHRVILDEAHIIRNFSTRACQACLALDAKYRFCLTGTPVLNFAEDIRCLFSFLKVDPLGKRRVFQSAISKPIHHGESVGLTRLRTMMAYTSLRRTKAGVNIKMAPKTVTLHKLLFPPDCPHGKIHEVVYGTARACVRATLSVTGVAVSRLYMHILETLMRIRQACCSGYLIPPKRLQAAKLIMEEIHSLGAAHKLTMEEGLKLLQRLNGAIRNSDSQCAICLSMMNEEGAVVLRACSHVFCQSCISRVLGRAQVASCPMCRVGFGADDMIPKAAAIEAVGQNDTTRSTMFEQTPADSTGTNQHCRDSSSINATTTPWSRKQQSPSPKLMALMDALIALPHNEKAVVFSQFTSFLNMIEPLLDSEGISYERIDGSCSTTQRVQSMRDFSTEHGGPTVMLCSLHAAGTGVNFTRANHVFLMDTWWNRAVENQALDRVHRIGQKRPVRAVRFIMKGTVEERMIELQQKKEAIGKGSMERLTEEEKRMTLAQLRSLFDLDDLREDQDDDNAASIVVSR